MSAARPRRSHQTVGPATEECCWWAPPEPQRSPQPFQQWVLERRHSSGTTAATLPNSNNNTHVAHQQRCARSPVSTTSRLASSGAGVLRWARAHCKCWPLTLSCGVPWSHGHAPQPHAPALVVASSLTACHSPTRYLATSTPVIIGGWTDRPMISREEIMTVCGDRPLHDAPCDPTSPSPSPSPSTSD